MSYLKNIQQFTGSNMGGILPTIRLARKDDFISIPSPVDGIIYGDIVFKPGKGWYSWKGTLATGSTDSDTRQSNEGPSRGNRLPFSIAKYDAGVHNMFVQATDDEFIVLLKDANGKQKLFGLLEAPVRFSFSHNTGTAFANKNAFSCRFFYDGPENMYEYNGAVAAAPAGPAPAVVKFGNSEETAVAIASLAPGETLIIISDYSLTEYFITT